MEDELHRRVIGQDEGVKSLSRAIHRTRAGLKDPDRPTGSFIFVGPNGVGKTELAKTFAEFLFGEEESLSNLAMLEFQEKRTVSRLFASAACSVGCEQAGILIQRVRRRPFALAVCDVVEKAHAALFISVKHILEDDRHAESQGREVDFKSTVIIMTTNLGTIDISSG